MSSLESRQLSPKFDVVKNVPMQAWEAVSVVIQALVGGVSGDMRDELIIGVLKHLTGNDVDYDKSLGTFTVIDKESK